MDMFKFRNKVVFRFNLLLIFGFFVWALIIIVKAGIIMTLERQFWLDVAKKGVVYNKPIEPKRGDILSDNGELMVSNLVKYKVYINFENLSGYRFGEKKMARIQHRKDSIWRTDMDSLCIGLSRIIPQWSAKEFEYHLKKGLELYRVKGKGRKKYPICPNHQWYLSYSQYKKIKQLPILGLDRMYSGMEVEEHKYRKKFFGSLAYSTLGDYKILGRNKDGTVRSDKHGLDAKYDSILRGKRGTMHSEKEKEIVDVPVEHGMDIQTTLNVEMLDICEKALRKGLDEYDSKAGWVVLMEVKTGDIKAIVNLSRDEHGNLVETYAQNSNNETPNHAIADLREPGSIFKPVALTIALEDGKIHESDSLEAHKSIIMHGRSITDAVTPKGKWQTVTEVIMNSSNVGMAYIINGAYKNNPRRFTDRLKELGMKDNYNLLDCEGTPTFRTPDSKYWSSPDLQAMSRGYATSQTAINMVTFYNTIANGGTRMAPRLVKAILKDGEVVKEFEPRVLDEQLISKNTVESLTRMLTAVVEGKGATGKRAKSDKVKIAGKTGTALNDKGNLLSFCGFFPADNPEYTCIVQNVKTSPGGGGGTSAPIFKEIAENIMASSERRPLVEAKDTLHGVMPKAKCGNMTSVNYVLDELDIDVLDNNVSDDEDDPTWGMLACDESDKLSYEVREMAGNLVPNVVGMGAKDALYLMKRVGLRPTINGHGRVVEQSINPGRKAVKGAYVRLVLKP